MRLRAVEVEISATQWAHVTPEKGLLLMWVYALGQVWQVEWSALCALNGVLLV